MRVIKIQREALVDEMHPLMRLNDAAMIHVREKGGHLNAKPDETGTCVCEVPELSRGSVKSNRRAWRSDLRALRCRVVSGRLWRSWLSWGAGRLHRLLRNYRRWLYKHRRSIDLPRRALATKQRKTERKIEISHHSSHERIIHSRSI